MVAVVVWSVQTFNSQSSKPANYEAPDGFINLKIRKSSLKLSKKKKKFVFFVGLGKIFAIGYLSPPNPNSFLSFPAPHAGDKTGQWPREQAQSTASSGSCLPGKRRLSFYFSTLTVSLKSSQLNEVLRF